MVYEATTSGIFGTKTEKISQQSNNSRSKHLKEIKSKFETSTKRFAKNFDLKLIAEVRSKNYQSSVCVLLFSHSVIYFHTFFGGGDIIQMNFMRVGLAGRVSPLFF